MLDPNRSVRVTEHLVAYLMTLRERFKSQHIAPDPTVLLSAVIAALPVQQRPEVIHATVDQSSSFLFHVTGRSVLILASDSAEHTRQALMLVGYHLYQQQIGQSIALVAPFETGEWTAPEFIWGRLFADILLADRLAFSL